MKSFVFEMRTPEKVFLNEEVEYVTLPSSEGGYGVLASHAPVVLWLNSGVCEYTKNGTKARVYIMEGVADVTPDKVTVLSDFIEKESDLESALKAREEYFAAEKQRRKESYIHFKQSSIELVKAMKNLAGKKPEIE